MTTKDFKRQWSDKFQLEVLFSLPETQTTHSMTIECFRGDVYAVFCVALESDYTDSIEIRWFNPDKDQWELCPPHVARLTGDVPDWRADGHQPFPRSPV
jgi:hypothetical protein